MSDRVAKYAKIMAESQRETYVFNIQAMAEAVVAEVDREIAAQYTEAYNAGIRDGFSQGHSDYGGGSYYG